MSNPVISDTERRWRQFRSVMNLKPARGASDENEIRAEIEAAPTFKELRRTMLCAIDNYRIVGCYPRGVKLTNIILALMAGNGIRSVSRLVGCHKTTAAKVRRQMVAQRGEIHCPCGQPCTHRGWCHFRFVKSPRRQAIVAAFHNSRPFA